MRRPRRLSQRRAPDVPTASPPMPPPASPTDPASCRGRSVAPGPSIEPRTPSGFLRRGSALLGGAPRRSEPNRHAASRWELLTYRNSPGRVIGAPTRITPGAERHGPPCPEIHPAEPVRPGGANPFHSPQSSFLKNVASDRRGAKSAHQPPTTPRTAGAKTPPRPPRRASGPRGAESPVLRSPRSVRLGGANPFRLTQTSFQITTCAESQVRPIGAPTASRPRLDRAEGEPKASRPGIRHGGAAGPGTGPGAISSGSSAATTRSRARRPGDRHSTPG
ncbi:hypothetical protein ElP_70500 (plasmid) [Tautonia plasticadhaerens]|uniref:Uncharacterized protein n=1 Tax=Tautonia plasticadhaerens TaxID=2527974 RepID=A0A518HE07_9BACT|nr:hypothetical protein ElP_70500 [Tautonia plasticadhaerens]